MQETKRNKYTIQYKNPATTEVLITIIMAINKVEAKTLFIRNHPGCQLLCMLENREENE